MDTPHLDSRSFDWVSEAESEERFARLQERLPEVWAVMRRNLPGESIVVIPSVVPADPGIPGSVLQAQEERLLFLLLLLRQPRLQMIYVTSLRIAPTIIEYYLALLPGVIPSHARPRLHFVSVDDGSARPLSKKLLERPEILHRVRGLIPDPKLCHLVPYATTTRERDIALALDIPMYGADPRFFAFGTKSGCRRLFADERVPCPLGFEDLHSPDEVVDALLELRRVRPAAKRALVKLNDGVAGLGNAVVDLEGLSSARSECVARLDAMALESPSLTVESFFAELDEHGGIVEERITGRSLRSPSVQLRVTPFGEVELL
jgi:hypothetical protein